MDTAAHIELARAYRAFVGLQDTASTERRLAAAYRVIAAWEAVSDRVKTLCETAIAEKALTRQA
jgi:hypothetical protein